jgi:hypothetical protein
LNDQVLGTVTWSGDAHDLKVVPPYARYTVRWRHDRNIIRAQALQLVSWEVGARSGGGRDEV